MMKHHRRISRCLYLMGIAVIALMAGNGCGQYQLAGFNKHAARGDHAWIAGQAIDCRQPSETCSRLHCFKGEACLKLADAGIRPPVNYHCAINEFTTGLALLSEEATGNERLRCQELLCQALTHAQQAQVSQTADRVLATAKALYRLSPGSVPAHYYLSRARLMEIQNMPHPHGTAARIPACIRLKRTTTDVLSMIQSAEHQPPPQWDRFAEKYQRLAFDLGEALGMLNCR